MKKIVLTAIVAVSSLACNAEECKVIDEEVQTSCGDTYTIHEIGDNVTAEQLEAYKAYMEWVYCG